MSSDPEINRGIAAGKKLLLKEMTNSRIQRGTKPQPEDDTSDQEHVFIGDAINRVADDEEQVQKEAEYATFDIKPRPSRFIWQRVILALFGLAVFITALFGIYLFFFDLAPKLSNTDSGQTSQIEHKPTVEDIAKEYIASIEPKPTPVNPDPEIHRVQTPTQAQNGDPSSATFIPFGALPRLIEIDPSTKDDGAHEHMSHLESLRPW